MATARGDAIFAALRAIRQCCGAALPMVWDSMGAASCTATKRRAEDCNGSNALFGAAEVRLSTPAKTPPVLRQCGDAVTFAPRKSLL